MRSVASLSEAPFLRLHDHRRLSDLKKLVSRYPRTPHALLLQDGKPTAVLAAHRLRELLHRRDIPGDTPLRDLASTDWIVLGGDVQLYELVGEFRRSATEIALLCRDGEPPKRADDVLAVVTVEDVLADTGLPVRLLRQK